MAEPSIDLSQLRMIRRTLTDPGVGPEAARRLREDLQLLINELVAALARMQPASQEQTQLAQGGSSGFVPSSFLHMGS